MFKRAYLMWVTHNTVIHPLNNHRIKCLSLQVEIISVYHTNHSSNTDKFYIAKKYKYNTTNFWKHKVIKRNNCEWIMHHTLSKLFYEKTLHVHDCALFSFLIRLDKTASLKKNTVKDKILFWWHLLQQLHKWK